LKSQRERETKDELDIQRLQIKKSRGEIQQFCHVTGLHSPDRSPNIRLKQPDKPALHRRKVPLFFFSFFFFTWLFLFLFLFAPF
jgi:hypothetical protein